MTFTTYIVFAIVLFLAIQYNKLIDRERMYKEYYDWSLQYMRSFDFDPISTLKRLAARSETEIDEKVAKEAIEDAFVHHFRTLGVKIENLKIYWNEST